MMIFFDFASLFFAFRYNAPFVVPSLAGIKHICPPQDYDTLHGKQQLASIFL
jgi:hypothetical protein